jgi:hypothetical protein
VIAIHTRYLSLPEVPWPGVLQALGNLAPPDFEVDHAWIQWETWYSQEDVPLPPGVDHWKVRLYKSYLPPVGALLDTDPRKFEVRDIR